jgi:hypothetical protein
VQEEQTGSDPQEAQAQEVSEVDEQEEDLPECVDHQPSSFERGKHQSILNFLLYIYIYIYIYIALSYRSCMKPLMHLLLSLSTLLPN